MIRGSAATSAERTVQADPSGHMKQHALAGEGGGRHTEYYKNSDENGGTSGRVRNTLCSRYSGLTETVSDGFFCIGCRGKEITGVHMTDTTKVVGNRERLP